MCVLAIPLCYIKPSVGVVKLGEAVSGPVLVQRRKIGLPLGYTLSFRFASSRRFSEGKLRSSVSSSVVSCILDVLSKG